MIILNSPQQNDPRVSAQRLYRICYRASRFRHSSNSKNLTDILQIKENNDERNITHQKKNYHPFTMMTLTDPIQIKWVALRWNAIGLHCIRQHPTSHAW